MKLNNSYIAVILLLALTACNSSNTDSENYPQDADKQRQARVGKLTSEGGLTLFGGGDSKKKGGGVGIGGTVNPYIWRAALESLSFLPIASADPIGGVILTDWYEEPETPGERVRVNVMVLDKEMRADAVLVRTFKQTKNASGNWQDAKVDPSLGHQLEDTILTKARELKIKTEKS